MSNAEVKRALKVMLDLRGAASMAEADLRALTRVELGWLSVELVTDAVVLETHYTGVVRQEKIAIPFGTIEKLCDAMRALAARGPLPRVERGKLVEE